MTADADPWGAVTAARLPAAGLACLGAVRDRPGVRVHLSGELAWVTWPAGDRAVVECLRPAPGVTFFTPRGSAWYWFGRRVPTSDRLPTGAGQPLDAVIVPGRLAPVPPGESVPDPVRVGVVRGGSAVPASALRCRVAELLSWADTAPTAELTAVRAARRGEVALLRGAKLPTVPGATRFWGTTLLVPLGFRPDPDLPPEAIRAAAGVAADEVLILDEAGADVVPEAAFAPLSRAGLRLAAQH